MKRLLFSLLLLTAAFRAEAFDYTGLWYNSAESGYGYNLVQSDNYIFATFFIYGPNGQPTWYSAGLDYDGNGHFSGNLNATVGTYFAAPWVPGNFGGMAVGTVTFTPNVQTPWTGTMVMAVTGAPVISKSIEMQTLQSIALGGVYNGGQSGSYFGCTDNTQNYAYIDRYDLTVNHLSNGTVTMSFVYSSGLSCSFQGTLVQHGQLYSVPSAAYTCSDGLNTTASMSEIKATSLGIEGRYFAPAVGGACAETANFAAVLN